MLQKVFDPEGSVVCSVLHEVEESDSVLPEVLRCAAVEEQSSPSFNKIPNLGLREWILLRDVGSTNSKDRTMRGEKVVKFAGSVCAVSV